MQRLQCDVLVIGGGLAGCWAALRAKDFVDKVVIVEKAAIARSGTTTFTNSMLAPGPEDKTGSWLQEIVEAGEYLSDQNWVEVLLKEQPLRIEDLARWGAPFQRDSEGKLATTPGRGHRNTRLIMCNGHRLMELMKKKVLEKGVNIIERTMIVNLLTSDGRYPTAGAVVGAVGFHARNGEFFVCQAKSVVITTGMIDSKLRADYTNNLTGDGPAMAYRAGAELLGMEFCTVGKINCFETKYRSGGSSLLQGLGARFINAKGEEFVGKYDPVLKNRAKLSWLCQSFARESMEGRGPVYIDMRSFSPETVELVRKLLPTQMEPFIRAGINIRERPIQITPVVCIATPSGQGGIRINTNCQSSIEGLYAAGAAARNLVHGTYSIGGINLAFCNVAGYRAGENAGKNAQKAPDFGLNERQIAALKQDIFSPLGRKEGVTPDEVFHRFHQITIPSRASMFKTENRIRDVLKQIRALAQEELPELKAVDIHELVKANEARNLVLLSELVFRSALARKESRDTHYRLDYPYRDDIDWLKWVIVKRRDGNEIEVRGEPIPFEKYPVKPKERTRIPHPVQFHLSGTEGGESLI
jgi:succinate dehydrogenase/fumarate reductase flavoprotein subunit